MSVLYKYTQCLSDFCTCGDVVLCGFVVAWLAYIIEGNQCILMMPCLDSFARLEYRAEVTLKHSYLKKDINKVDR